MRIFKAIAAFSRRLGITATILLIILIAARAALPYVLERYVNRTLADLPGYRGELSSIGVNLWRGAYNINDLRIVKTDGHVPVPFFSSKEVDLSIQWKALLHGALVGSAWLETPRLNFVNGKSKQDTQAGMEEGWREPLKRLFPVRFNEIRVHDGEIHFRDFHRTPQVDVYLNSVNARASNFTNSLGISKSLVARIEGTGKAQDHSELGIELDFDPFSKDINFSFKGQIENLQLKRLNDLFLAYANFDFEAGTLSVYSKVEARKDGFKGYVKPLFKDVKTISTEQAERGPLRTLWEAVVSAVFELFKNQRQDQFAGVIPIEGSWGSPEVGTLSTVLSVLKNAFIEALRPGLMPDNRDEAETR